jgi:hypothetical protein
LVAWFFTPLYATNTRVFSITFTPWGIMAKSPGGSKCWVPAWHAFS